MYKIYRNAITDMWKETEEREIDRLRKVNGELLRAIKESLVFFECIGMNEHNKCCGVTFTCDMCQQVKFLCSIIRKAEDQI